MNQINPFQLIGAAVFRVQYLDYEPEQWTVWQRLSKKRLEEILDDYSVSKIQLKPDLEDLIYDLDDI